jgi:glycine C-acetyltransferase
LRQIKQENLYRNLRSITVSGTTAIVDGEKKIHLCSNDYLGLSSNSLVRRLARTSIGGVSPCSSRLIAGNNPAITGLEAALATHRNCEASLVYPTGYMANFGAITALADENTTILSDELNHASIIDACRLSGAEIRVFRHNDTDHLESIMRGASGRTLVVTEGVFSMDGDVAELKELVRIARKLGALTLVDDAHGDFIFGEKYSGIPSSLGVEVDVHVSSLSKGLGCFGGYVASSRRVIDFLINTSRQFIYTSAIPAHLCSAAVQAIKLAKRGNLQKQLSRNIDHLKGELGDAGFVLGSTVSQIMPIIVGSEEKAVKFSSELLDRGVLAQAVRYPTVKKGAARLRLSVTAAHTTRQLANATKALRAAGKTAGVI